MPLLSQDVDFKPVHDSKPLVDRINAANQGLNTLQCDFDQEKELSFLEEKVHSSGKFFYQKKDKIRWEYDKPYPYIIVMNGSVIRIRDGEKTTRQDASSSRLYSSINAVMTGIIDGSAISNDQYFTSTFLENATMVKVVMAPSVQGMKDFISSIEIYLGKADYGVESMKILEKSGDYTLIRFKNKKLNASIPEAVFSVN
jgi:outer membrane lipoprotein-sorting protein